MYQTPHPIPYQGSKRKLTAFILKYVPRGVERLFEPFAGSAAVTLAAASQGLAARYVLGENLKPLALLWKRIVEDPLDIAAHYERIWTAQLGGPRDHYIKIRCTFNKTQRPELLLYLLARCVKNAVRFNPSGEFNQSADHRRSGMHPNKMKGHIIGASNLLSRRCEVIASDYKTLLAAATPKDLIYMDPPYQGVSGGKDRRYFKQLDREEFLGQLDALNRRRVPYLLSFDGFLGAKQYGQEMPKELRLKQILIRVGRSSQATLGGRTDETVESLYISPHLSRNFPDIPAELHITRKVHQLPLQIQI